MDSILRIPKILLPKAGTDYSKWSVNAVDQFTCQDDYWTALDSYCDAPSTLRLVYPEVYLKRSDRAQRVAVIHDNMKRYIEQGVFYEVNDLILVERTLNTGVVRLGLMVAVDLDKYDFRLGSNPKIRATEATVVDRLPVRVEIRRGATLEFPHTMMLFDEPQDTIVPALYESRNTLEKLYDFDLNMNGGHLRGYRVKDSAKVVAAIEGLPSNNPFKYAIGDGNHSLAAAKLYWEELKATLPEERRAEHPARFALVEMMNLHSKGLLFQPIHRVLFNAPARVIEDMSSAMSGNSTLVAVYNGKSYSIPCSDVPADTYLAVANFLEAYNVQHPEMIIDYVHGEEHLAHVAAEQNGVALYMPNIPKASLFPYVNAHGTLPKKAFSMGEAEDKRYYLEGKVIAE